MNPGFPGLVGSLADTIGVLEVRAGVEALEALEGFMGVEWKEGLKDWSVSEDGVVKSEDGVMRSEDGVVKSEDGVMRSEDSVNIFDILGGLDPSNKHK